MMALVHLVSVTNSGDPRDVLVLGWGLPGISSFQAPLHPVPGSLAVLHAALLIQINPGHPQQSVHLLHQQQLSAPAVHHLELRLEVSCERLGYLHPSYLSCHVLLSDGLPHNNLKDWWPECEPMCHLQTALKIKKALISKYSNINVKLF